MSASKFYVGAKNVAKLARFITGMTLCADISSATACPVLEGPYVTRFERDGRRIKRSMPIISQFVNGVILYRIVRDGYWYPADNVSRPIEVRGDRGTVKLRCSGQTLVIELHDNDSKQTAVREIRKLNDKQLLVTTNVENGSGIYERE